MILYHSDNQLLINT